LTSQHQTKCAVATLQQKNSEHPSITRLNITSLFHKSDEFKIV